jgi:cell division protein FtsL
MELDAALKNFRESMHGWSEQEFSKTRVIRRSRWDAAWRAIASPAMAWTMSCALLVASVGGSLTIHHERQVEAARQQATLKQQQMEQEKAAMMAENKAAATANSAMDDDELLSHVDSDIAQAAPDAMQPLAILMSDSGSAGAEKSADKQ